MKLNKREITFLGKDLPAANQLSLFANIQIDLDGTEKITERHLSEAIHYKSIDKKYERR